GSSITYTVHGTIATGATGTLSNTATTTPPDGLGNDATPADNTANDTDTLTPQATLTASVTASPNPVSEGGTLTYAVSITNQGPSDDTNVVLTDALPAGVVFQSATFGAITGTESSGTVTVHLGTIAAGATVNGTIVVVTPEEGQVAADTIQVTSDFASTTATSAAVTVTDPPVNVSSAPLTLQAGVNLGSLFLGSFTDPGGAEPNAADPAPTPYRVDVAWGDGLGDTGAITFDSVNKVFAITAGHVYGHEGFYTITLTVHHG